MKNQKPIILALLVSVFWFGFLYSAYAEEDLSNELIEYINNNYSQYENYIILECTGTLGEGVSAYLFNDNYSGRSDDTIKMIGDRLATPPDYLCIVNTDIEHLYRVSNSGNLLYKNEMLISKNDLFYTEGENEGDVFFSGPSSPPVEAMRAGIPVILTMILKVGTMGIIAIATILGFRLLRVGLFKKLRSYFNQL